MNFGRIVGCLLVALLWSQSAHADHAFSDRLSSLIKKTLEEKIPNSEITLPSLDQIAKSTELSDFETLADVRLLEDRPNGVALFEVVGKDPEERPLTQKIQTPYEAWVKVPIALHRIYPNTQLKTEDFKIGSINVSTGQAREFRGVLASADTMVDRMETRQTILEGQFLVTSAMQKKPDVRRGDLVKLELNSGELSLSTQAVIQESAAVGDRVRVLTVKTKKEVVGTLRDDHSVGVNL